MLTKSKYLSGLQCPKYLWVMCNDKDRIPEPGTMLQHLFREGDKVGEFAKKLYPEGINISFGNSFLKGSNKVIFSFVDKLDAASSEFEK